MSEKRTTVRAVMYADRAKRLTRSRLEKTRFARAFRAELEEHGLTLEDAAAALDCSYQLVQKFLGPNHAFPAERFIQLPRPVLAGVLSRLLPTPPSAARDYLPGPGLAVLIRELSDPGRVAALSHADGFVSPEEAAQELREIAEAKRVLDERAEWLRTVIERRGVKL